MTPLMLISVLVASNMWIVQGQQQCNGRCVLYKDCPMIFELVKKQTRTPQELETLRTAHCGYDGQKPKACCKEPRVEPDYSRTNPDGQNGRFVGLYSCPPIVNILQQRAVPLDNVTFVQNSRCVLYKDCPKLLEVVKKQTKTPQELEMLTSAHCGYDGLKPKVCCKEPPVAPDRSCVNPDGQNGQCVGLYSCPTIVSILQQRSVLPDEVTFVQNSRCEGSEAYSFCCSPEPRQTIAPAPEVCRPQAIPPQRSSECCGRDAMQGNKIIGGNLTSVDQYPWLALIEYRGNPDEEIKLLCGGTLISSKYVLTAGHCVTGLEEPTNVRLGEYDTSIDGKDCTPAEGGGEDCTEGLVIIPIERVIPHPDYDPDNRFRRNDIALIRLAQLAPYTDFIRPICLPTTDISTNPPQGSLYVAGWGAMDTRHSKSKIKLHVDLPFKTMAECQLSYNEPSRYVPLWRGQICAGGETGKDSCKGDSGGPLMYENRQAFEVVGIVSFGPRVCGLENVPGVYTKVYEYNMWIRSLIHD